MASVQIRNLSRAFQRRDGDSLKVLDGLTIEAADREFVCLLGPSGCGKSTVLNILAQLAEPDRGEILVNGASDYRRHKFGYVFQQPRLLNWMTVRQNLCYPLRGQGLTRDEINRRAAIYLQLVGLTDFADEFPLSLSGGMQQRVGIARALAIEPEVLLMDEPFSNLDELTARAMRSELLKIWHETRKTIFFVTHNPFEAVYLADRIYLLTKRPSCVVREVSVRVPHPRAIDDAELTAIAKSVVRTLTEK
jgi:ABC-type nitrate/sulfonate/bicarbonate transport system ATPase subunit